jgi:hypothetical protein
MQEQIDQLKKDMEELRSLFTLQGMPYDTQEIIKRLVIKGEDATVTKTQIYTDSGTDTFTGPKAYAGILVLQAPGGKEYNIPYVQNT